MNKELSGKNEICIIRPIREFLSQAIPVLVRMMNNEKSSGGAFLLQVLQSQTMRIVIEKIIEHCIWQIYSIDSERQTGIAATIISGAKKLDPGFEDWCTEISRIPHVRFVEMDRMFVSVEIISDVAHIRIYNG